MSKWFCREWGEYFIKDVFAIAWDFLQRDIYRKIFLVAVFIIILVLGFLITRAIAPNRSSILIGAWTEGLFDPTTQTIHPEALTSFEQLAHKKMSLAHYYIGWEALSSPQLILQFNLLESHGWEPVLNVNPYYFSGCPSSPLPLYRAIAVGECDTFLKAAARNLASFHHPFFLVFAWEMNNEQNAWSTMMSGSTPSDFIAAWRHMHDIFVANGATNVLWVFCPNVPNNQTASYSSLYPGNTYVDWVGLDGYNWGTTQSWSTWESFSEVFQSSYDDITSVALNKPVMIAEVGTTEDGGSKAGWYQSMLTDEIPNEFPEVRAVVFFNEDRTVQEGVNWKVNTSPSALAAFTQGIQLPLYK